MDARAPEILIIGAGAAGLAAADELARHGIPALVLEARSRPFGRVDTVHHTAWPVAIERGAEFLHGNAEMSLSLAREVRGRLETVPDEHCWLENGRVRKPQDMGSLLKEAVAREPRRPRDRSLAEVFAAMTLARRKRLEPARLFVEGYHAADIAEVSAKWLAAASGAGGDEEQHRAVEGYQAVLGVLHARLAPQVRLNTTVTRITWRRGRVRLDLRSTDSGAPTAGREGRACIVTVPLGVLQAGTIAFAPKPPWTPALRKLEMGAVQKMTLLFRDRFWLEAPAWAGRKHVPDFWHAHGLPFPTWWTMAPREEPVLAGWVGGPAAQALRGRNEAEIIDRALSSLSSMLGLRRSTIVASLVAPYHHDWTPSAAAPMPTSASAASPRKRRWRGRSRTR